MSSTIPIELRSTFLFGDNEEFESFLGDELQGFSFQQLATRVEAGPRQSSLVSFLFMVNHDDVGDDYDDESLIIPQLEMVKPADKESIQKLEKVRIEALGLTCPVCLEEHSVGSEAKRLPCSHVYHESCILEWLMRSDTCPLCRHQIPKSS